MAYPDINNVNDLNCSQLAFINDGSGNINAAYLNCGDYTPFTIANTGGTPNAVYKVLSGVAASVIMTTGTLSAGNQVGGYGQRYVPYAQVVTTVASLTSIPAGNYLG